MQVHCVCHQNSDRIFNWMKAVAERKKKKKNEQIYQRPPNSCVIYRYQCITKYTISVSPIHCHTHSVTVSQFFSLYLLLLLVLLLAYAFFFTNYIFKNPVFIGLKIEIFHRISRWKVFQLCSLRMLPVPMQNQKQNPVSPNNPPNKPSETGMSSPRKQQRPTLLTPLGHRSLAPNKHYHFLPVLQVQLLLVLLIFFFVFSCRTPLKWQHNQHIMLHYQWQNNQHIDYGRRLQYQSSI